MNRDGTESEKIILAGDIGATKTNLAVYPMAGQRLSALLEKKYRNAEFASLGEIVADFLARLAETPASCCFGIAGPVTDGRVAMTNRDWVVDVRQLKAEFGFSRVELINDLAATALGTTVLEEDELLTINTGRSQPGGNIGVIAPGTGLGEAFLTSRNDGIRAHASEGGHASFAPRNEQQVALWRYMRQQYEHVSCELVCSGRALPELYGFLRAGGAYDAERLDNELAQADSAVPHIISAALKYGESRSPHYELAGAVVELFLDILAAEAANLALKILAVGGIFIGGGIMPRIVPLFDGARFMDIFCRGVYADLLSAIPLHIIVNPKTALLGAAVRAGWIDQSAISA